LYRILDRSVSGGTEGSMLGVHAQGADVLAMQWVASIAAGCTDIEIDTDLLSGFDQYKLVILPSCNKGAHGFAQIGHDT